MGLLPLNFLNIVRSKYYSGDTFFKTQRINMKKLAILLIICIGAFFQYCSSSKKVSKPAYIPMNYISNVQPTILSSCSPCHIPPKGFYRALNTYDAAKTNIDNIISRINLTPGERGFMPFKHQKLSDSVINVFVQWKADGLLEK